MDQDLQKLKTEITEKLKNIKDSDALRDLEIFYLGRKGKLTALLRNLSSLPDELRKTAGLEANELKEELAKQLKDLKEKFLAGPAQGFIDVTLPGKKLERGHLHPITIIQDELEEIFKAMGFMVLDGPEMESDYYNFTALNIPPFHPARDMQDTFYVDMKNKSGDYDLVMRTHTSPVEVRAMLKYGAPLKCIVPGRVFRNEATDACHDTTFYQIEGLMIDKNISISNLISVMKEMLTAILKQDVKLRIRPGYFPFVEPGLEVDVCCTICGGTGCPSCKHSGWLEMIGAGMSHPNVLRAGKIDPEIYNGFAFGVGLTRLAMMKYGIEDIRLFNSGDLRFIEQF